MQSLVCIELPWDVTRLIIKLNKEILNYVSNLAADIFS